MIKVKRALISVSDKKGIVAFARKLYSLKIDIISTGGTARQLKDAGIPVLEVSDYTGFPEILDGRVKTLHPKIYGGLLAQREKTDHMKQIKDRHIGLIDMVVVNLYPFESVIQKKKATLADAVKNIDIGGPAMLRAAAKNFSDVAVICNPERYNEISRELDMNNGLLSDSVLFKLSVEAFKHTSRYDEVISHFLNKHLSPDGFAALDDKAKWMDTLPADQHLAVSPPLPKQIDFKFSKIQDLRYGENPHQRASFYKDFGELNGLAGSKQLQGKVLSFNNILDLNAAVNCIIDLEGPAAVIIKHNNPTGVCEAKNLAAAYTQAWRCDAISAFGGIVGLNKKVDESTAKAIIKSGFLECIIAPGFEKEAQKIFSRKKNLRLITYNFKQTKNKSFDFKKVQGGLLLQELDRRKLKRDEIKTVTRRKPTQQQMDSFLFGWAIIKNIKSNAVILVKGKKTIGIGAGQTSRVESVKLAIEKAGDKAKNSVLVSDAFLPHIDNVQLAAKAGIKAIIQSGGSKMDNDIIKEANKAKIAMAVTGIRHFKH